MRKITLTTPISMPELPGQGASSLTDGKLGEVVVERDSADVRYDTCVCTDDGMAKHGLGGDVMRYLDLDAAGQAVVDAFLDLVLDHAQSQGHIPAGPKA